MKLIFIIPTYVFISEFKDHLSVEIEIPRITKKEMNSIEICEMSPVKLVPFNGPKKPVPPELVCHTGQSFELVSQTATSVRFALETDIRWLVSMMDNIDGDNPKSEWSGTMTNLAREMGKTPSAANQFVFGPLIDSPPAHPDTVLTTLIFIEKFMKQHGMSYIHLSADMQLYKVILQIKWSQPTKWSNLIVRPGGMHTLMSFCGCIGVLMNGSGLEELLSVAFKGVSYMLNGKAWPKAVRGLRMVVTALLEPLISYGKTTVSELEDELEKVRQSRTGRLWTDCLITPVMIIHHYIRAEREGDWLLHMYALKKMIPYFFAAHHNNYARYISWHVLEMTSSLPQSILLAFLRGEHVCRHRNGIWNSVFLDQFGEQTYIRYGKSKGGLVGKSLSPEQVSEWILSHHLCNTLSMLMENMFEETADEYVQTAHKEEGENRKKLDAADRNKIIRELGRYSNPMTMQQEEPLSNIINGRIASDEVNVDNALVIGNKLAARFVTELPCGFYTPIKKEVVTMENMKKRVKIGDTSVYDVEKLYARLLVIAQSRDIQLSDLFKYELSPVPSSLFDDYGDMRKGNKAVLIHNLAVFSTGSLGPVEAEIIDGNEAIYHTSWSRNTTLKNFAENFVNSFDNIHDTYVIFDRYDKQSIKCHERIRRAKGNKPREYMLNSNTELPARDIFMKSDENKRKLIQYMCNTNITNPHLRLIGDDCIYGHEEADVKIICYLLEMLSQRKHIQIRADDTDIFVLLVFFVWHCKSATQVSMKKYSGKVIDINATASKLGNKCYDLLAVHALSGCDTTSYPFGKGKVSAIKMLVKLDLKLDVFIDPESQEEDWMKAGKNFLSYLYYGKTVESLSKLRYTLFTMKKDPPKIKSLPPTDESAHEHIKRARLQVLIWRAADHPSTTDPTIYGWKIEGNIPIPVFGNADVIPKSLLQLVSCGCLSEFPCSRITCSCRAARLSCSLYCKCRADEHCGNQMTKKPSSSVVETDDDDSEEEIY